MRDNKIKITKIVCSETSGKRKIKTERERSNHYTVPGLYAPDLKTKLIKTSKWSKNLKYQVTTYEKWKKYLCSKNLLRPVTIHTRSGQQYKFLTSINFHTRKNEKNTIQQFPTTIKIPFVIPYNKFTYNFYRNPFTCKI